MAAALHRGANVSKLSFGLFLPAKSTDSFLRSLLTRLGYVFIDNAVINRAILVASFENRTSRGYPSPILRILLAKGPQERLLIGYGPRREEAVSPRPPPFIQ